MSTEVSNSDPIAPSGVETSKERSNPQTEPHDLAAERSVLGAMIMEPKLCGSLQLHSHDFYRPAHGIIFTALLQMFGEAKPITPITLAAELTKSAQLNKVGGAGYVQGLYQACPSPAFAENDAYIVWEKSVRRNAMGVCQRSYLELSSGEGELPEVLARFHQGSMQVSATGTLEAEEEPQVSSARSEFFIDMLMSGVKKGVPTGFRDLDNLTGGLKGGQLITVAGRPAMGKSVFATNVAQNASLEGKKVALFSLEMGHEEITARQISSLGKGVNLNLLKPERQKEMTKEDWDRVSKAVSIMQESDSLRVIDNLRNFGAIKVRSRSLAAIEGLDLIVVDHLGLLNDAKGKGIPETVRLESITTSAKELARELDVPVIMVSQLNRNGATPGLDGEVREPSLTDLRGSGAIEQDSDIVILLHREDYYQPESTRAGEGDVIVAKHRNGPTRKITVAWQGHYARFRDMCPA